MAIYGLQNTSSLDIISLIQYDGSGSISIPSGGFQLYSGSYIPGTDYILNMFTASEYNLIDDLDGVLMATFRSLDGGEVIGVMDVSGSLEVTGSINITGSFTLNDKTFEDILDNQGINATNFGRLKYENSSNLNSTSPIVPNYLDTNEAPKRTYFRFNKERGSAFWNDPLMIQNEVEVITLSLDNLDLNVQNSYRYIIYDILLGNWIGSSLTLRSIDYPDTYKTFEILGGVAYQKQFITSQSPRYYKLEMKDNWRIIDTSMMLDPDFRFKNEHQYSLPNDGRITYVQLFVEEVESGMDEIRFPQHDDEFSVFITKGKKKRKEVFEFTSTTTPWQIPHWADKITIYTIGAGGGGGAGSAAWGHRYEEFSLNETKIDVSNAPIGFQFATGGGGGAGGNISIAEFLIDTANNKLNSSNIGKNLLPKFSDLNIYVGSGGKGGVGLTNNDSDYQVVLAKDIIKNPNLNWIETLLDSKIDDPSTGYKNWVMRLFIKLQSESSPLNANAYWRFQIGKTKGVGKNGGFSSVVLDSSSNTITNTEIELVRATGGIGGMHGIAMQTYYAIYHYICADDPHTLNEPNALGGGSYLNDSFGNKEIRPGGHGGYGVSMHNVLQPKIEYMSDVSAYVRKFTKLNTNKLKINLAPNIPWNSNSDKPNLQIPFGTNYILQTGETLDVDGWKAYKNGSYEKPIKIAPLGGNGGLGANWTGLENRTKEFILSLPNYFFQFDVENEYWERSLGSAQLDMPSYWFELISNEVLNNITFSNSDKPKIIGDNTLISTETTAVNGVTSNKYEFKLKNTGALGGLNIYNNTSGTEALLENVSLLDRVPTQPENGDHYGQGGGGGAAAYTTDWMNRTTPISGQNGGDGSNGIVIIIAEEL